jgi:hypothetical protein
MDAGAAEEPDKDVSMGEQQVTINTILSLHCHYTIKKLSLYQHFTKTVLSLHYHCTITVLPL